MINKTIELCLGIALLVISISFLLLIINDFRKRYKNDKGAKITCSNNDDDLEIRSTLFNFNGYPFKVDGDVHLIDTGETKIFVFKNSRDMPYIKRLLNKKDIVIFVSYEDKASYILHYDFTASYWISDELTSKLNVASIYEGVKINKKVNNRETRKMAREAYRMREAQRPDTL